jgi:hypothetical protein
MSALSQKADISEDRRHVCFVPKADIVKFTRAVDSTRRDYRPLHANAAADDSSSLPITTKEASLVVTGRRCGRAPSRALIAGPLTRNLATGILLADEAPHAAGLVVPVKAIRQFKPHEAVSGGEVRRPEPVSVDVHRSTPLS